MKYQVNRSTGDAYEEHSIEGTLTQVLVVLDALGMSKGEPIPCFLDSTEDSAYTPDNTEEWEDSTLGASAEHAVLASEEDTKEVNNILRAAKQKIPEWVSNAKIKYSRIPSTWEHAWITQDEDGSVFAFDREPFINKSCDTVEWLVFDDDVNITCLSTGDSSCVVEDFKSRCFQYF